jgi:hypothetical protein
MFSSPDPAQLSGKWRFSAGFMRLALAEGSALWNWRSVLAPFAELTSTAWFGLFDGSVRFAGGFFGIPRSKKAVRAEFAEDGRSAAFAFSVLNNHLNMSP